MICRAHVFDGFMDRWAVYDLLQRGLCCEHGLSWKVGLWVVGFAVRKQVTVTIIAL